MSYSGDFMPRDRSMHPPALHPGYKTSILRAPQQPLLAMRQTLSELTGPVFDDSDIRPLDNDLLRNACVDGEPIGERILVHGRVIDQNGRALAATLVEVWQANAGGRYRHVNDRYQAPLDPNFSGYGRCLTDSDGWYRLRTLKPGAYPWPNRVDDWRPAHIHFSLFGPALATRLITQMYFEGDPLLPGCPIFNSVADAGARQRLVATLDRTASAPFDALAYRFDMVLRGRKQTFFENRPEGM